MEKTKKYITITYKYGDNYYIDIVHDKNSIFYAWIWKEGCTFKQLFLKDIYPGTLDQMLIDMESDIEEAIEDYEFVLENKPPLLVLPPE